MSAEKGGTDALAFLKPFAWQLWLAIAASMLGIAFVCWLLSHLSPMGRFEVRTYWECSLGKYVSVDGFANVGWAEQCPPKFEWLCCRSSACAGSMSSTTKSASMLLSQVRTRQDLATRSPLNIVYDDNSSMHNNVPSH